LKKNDRELGFYRQMLECIYDLALEASKKRINRIALDKKIGAAIAVLDIHGINIRDIEKNFETKR